MDYYWYHLHLSTFLHTYALVILHFRTVLLLFCYTVCTAVQLFGYFHSRKCAK